MLKHKKLLFITSLIILLPMFAGLILWNQFPDRITTHWNLSGEADGFGSIAFTVFVPPLLMLAGHWVCFFFTCLDKGNQNRNQKPLTLVLWILPVISNISSFTMCGLALGWEFSPFALMMVPMGLMFALIGNYMPKMKMNSTMGIKIPWTYTSEENWNATHRFGGKAWFLGGIVLALSGLLPAGIVTAIMTPLFILLIILPIGYSWRYYRMQKARGDALLPFPATNTKTGKYSLLFLMILLVFVAVLMFTGDIDVIFAEDAFTVEASFYDDLTVDYDLIEAIEYRPGNVPGTRVGGFGSFRLLMGYFHNEEFGAYTRYTYYNPESCIVITTSSRTLVLSGKTAAETEAIYQQLLEKTAS